MSNYILNKKELMILDFSLKQTKSKLNKEIELIISKGINIDTYKSTLQDLDYLIAKVNKYLEFGPDYIYSCDDFIEKETEWKQG